MTRRNVFPRIPILLITVAVLALIALAPAARAETLPTLPLRDWTDERTELHGLLADDRPSLVNLWAVWCPPCRDELPLLLAGHDAGRYRLVAVNYGDAPDVVASFLFAHGLETLPVFFASVRDASRLRPPGLPTTLLVDAHGRILARHFGPLDESSLAALLEAKE